MYSETHCAVESLEHDDPRHEKGPPVALRDRRPSEGLHRLRFRVETRSAEGSRYLFLTTFGLTVTLTALAFTVLVPFTKVIRSK